MSEISVTQDFGDTAVMLGTTFGRSVDFHVTAEFAVRLGDLKLSCCATLAVACTPTPAVAPLSLAVQVPPNAVWA